MVSDPSGGDRHQQRDQQPDRDGRARRDRHRHPPISPLRHRRRAQQDRRLRCARRLHHRACTWRSWSASGRSSAAADSPTSHCRSLRRPWSRWPSSPCARACSDSPTTSSTGSAPRRTKCSRSSPTGSAARMRRTISCPGWRGSWPRVRARRGRTSGSSAVRTLRPDASWPTDAPDLPHLPADPFPEGLFPVRHQDELLGALSLEKRPGESLSATEQKLVEHLAGQAGLVLRNVRLTEALLARLEDLRASRQRLVAAQDEERRKLERNIHDGAQQQLVALRASKLARTAAGSPRPGQGARDAGADPGRHRRRARGPPGSRPGHLPAAAGRPGTRSSRSRRRRARRRCRPPSKATASVVSARTWRRPSTSACLEALQNIAKYAEASRHDRAHRRRRVDRVPGGRRRSGLRPRHHRVRDRSSRDRRPARRVGRRTRGRQRPGLGHLASRRAPAHAGRRGRLPCGLQPIGTERRLRDVGGRSALGRLGRVLRLLVGGAAGATTTVSEAARICRVASRPLMPGRFTSIRTRSGVRSAAIVTESSPVSASPTTSNPSVASTTMRAAIRNGSWSSTISTRTRHLILKRPTRPGPSPVVPAPLLGVVRDVPRVGATFGRNEGRVLAMKTAPPALRRRVTIAVSVAGLRLIAGDDTLAGSHVRAPRQRPAVTAAPPPRPSVMRRGRRSPLHRPGRDRGDRPAARHAAMDREPRRRDERPQLRVAPPGRLRLPAGSSPRVRTERGRPAPAPLQGGTSRTSWARITSPGSSG